MHPAIDTVFPRIEPDIEPNLRSALFDLAEILRKFQKGRYFCFKFSKCFQFLSAGYLGGVDPPYIGLVKFEGVQGYLWY